MRRLTVESDWLVHSPIELLFNVSTDVVATQGRHPHFMNLSFVFVILLKIWTGKLPI